jgi:hypothetical protein
MRIEAKHLKIEPGGRSLAVATTEGFMIFGVEDYLKSSAGNFSIASSKTDLLQMIKGRNYPGLIVSALSIRDSKMLELFLKQIPTTYIDIISQNLPTALLETFMAFLAKQIEESKDIELIMLWLRAVILYNQVHFDNINMGLLATLRTAIKALRHRISKISDLAMDNRYMLQFITSQIPEERELEAQGENGATTGMDIEVGRTKKDRLIINERKDSAL